MVKICDSKYPEENEKIFKEYFNNYSFSLSDFQKWGIESIVKGNHSLLCAHTGSGKTLPAEFAIDYFTSKKKKIIYTSPIKALSNQKYYDFTQKFPNISFGLITGDIKVNPEANVLIMTTEILLNKLYENNYKETQLTFEKNNGTHLNSFDMNIENDLECVVFDEVHYINDRDRGKVWEECLLMLPKNIQILMLSATIDKPEKFANWVEQRYKNDNKVVYLSGTNNRVVPLMHHSFITCNERLFKLLKNETLEKEIKKIINTPIMIKNSKEEFLEQPFCSVKKTLKILNDKNIYVKRQFALNQVTKYLVDNQMLPAICFVFSRKNVETCAKEITTNLLEDDSKVPYIIKKECEQIIRKIPNYQEYLALPEYNNMVSLLEKGIAIHHAGITPILREMVELCFSKGYIKLLLATETFAVGINMPTKTVIFTDVSKYDGNNTRMLLPHEYTQMAGRAGRRGTDKIGHVIQLSNLCRNLETIDYKIMMTGKPQTFVSKFKISYNLLLNLIYTENYDFLTFIKKSMIQIDVTNQLNEIEKNIQKKENEKINLENTIQKMNTSLTTIQKYIELNNNVNTSINKKKKEIQKQIQEIINCHKILDYEINIVNKYNDTNNEIKKIKIEYDELNIHLEKNINLVLDILIENNYIYKTFDEKNNILFSLNLKGFISCCLKEVNCILFTPLIEKKLLNNFTSKELVGIFSCFTNINVEEDNKTIIPYSKNEKVQNFIHSVNNDLQLIVEMEQEKQIHTGCDYNIQFDMIDFFISWCETENNEECRFLLSTIEKEKGVFLGDIVKGLLKVNNIASEMEKICEYTNNIMLLQKLKEIPHLILKYIVTNQSLYI